MFIHKLIIPQKESLSEYGSGWGWEENATYAHVLDLANGSYLASNGKLERDDTPRRLTSSGTNMHYCQNKWEITAGQTLFSGSVLLNQKSCIPDVSNAGNLYSWPASTAGGSSTVANYNEKNSVCPIGWRLSPNTGAKSYNNLISTAYGISDTKSDAKIRVLPLTFTYSADYKNGSLSIGYGIIGHYWTSTVVHQNYSKELYFSSSYLSPDYSGSVSSYREYGHSLRCLFSRF